MFSVRVIGDGSLFVKTFNKRKIRNRLTFPRMFVIY